MSIDANTKLRDEHRARNREAMPNAAALIDELRAVFGPVKVIYAEDRVTNFEVGDPDWDRNFVPLTPEHKPVNTTTATTRKRR